MPPKKSKKGKKAKVKDHPSETEVSVESSTTSMAAKEINYLEDLNEEFFASSNKTIQTLMETNRGFEASQIKKYVDIIFNLHRKYCDEVKETEILRPQITYADTKLRIALDFTMIGQETLDHLKQALAEAWKDTDASLQREQEIQMRLQDVLAKCASLESKESQVQDDSAEFGQLAKYKNIILRERDRINGEVTDLQKRLQLQRYYTESLEYINKTNEDNLQKSAMRIKGLETEKENLEIKVVNLQDNLDDQKQIYGKCLQKMEYLNRDLTDIKNRLSKRNQAYVRLKTASDKYRNENNMLIRTISTLDEELIELKRKYRSCEDACKALRLEDKVKISTITQISQKYRMALQENSILSSKLYKSNRLNNSNFDAINRYKNKISGLEKDIQVGLHKIEDLRRIKDNVTRDRDILKSDILKLNNQILDLRHLLVIQNNITDNLRLDVDKLNVKLDESKTTILKLEKERDEMQQETVTLNERIEYYQEQMEIKTVQISEITEKINQNQIALVNFKKQLESVHSQKMVLQRSLDATTQERDNYRLLQLKVSHQLAQQTSQITGNENTMVALNLKIEHLITEKKELLADAKNIENFLASLKKNQKTALAKNENLLKTITEDEVKFQKLTHELEETRKEKNLIGLQTVRRNDEIVLLKERIIILQSALDQGQTQYNQRVEDIRLLKIEIVNLHTERECLSRAIKSTADMRVEILHLQRTLNQERIKSRSLQEDAKAPTGVHRWRILKGEDPSRFKLIQKVQALQRRSLKQEVEKENLKHQLKELNDVCESLRRTVQTMPSTDVKERLVAFQRLTRTQSVKLKALNAELRVDKIELSARECVIEKYKDDVKKVLGELSRYKRSSIGVGGTGNRELTTNRQVGGGKRASVAAAVVVRSPEYRREGGQERKVDEEGASDDYDVEFEYETYGEEGSDFAITDSGEFENTESVFTGFNGTFEYSEENLNMKRGFYSQSSVAAGPLNEFSCNDDWTDCTSSVTSNKSECDQAHE